MRWFVLVCAASVVLIGGCAAQPSSVPTTSKGSSDQSAAKLAEARPAEALKPAAAASPSSAQSARPQSEPARPAATAAPKTASAPAVAAPAGQQPPRPAPTAGPAPQPTPAQPAEPAAVPAAQIGRMVIYTTELSILVKELGQVVGAVGDVVSQVGGYVAGVENKEESGRPLLTVRLKVPPERYEPTMRQLRGLAVEVTDEKAATQDVTEEFNDVQTQLAAQEASHSQLLELMGRAQSVEEILKVQEKLAQTKVQIDRLKGRMTFLQRSSDLATITLHARSAEDVLARNYTALRAQLRRSESQRATTQAALRKARTPEEEATLRDRLAEATLEISRLGARLEDIQAKAQRAGISLPAAPADEGVAAGPTGDDELGREYLTLRAQRRTTEVEKGRLTRELGQRRGPEESELRLRLTATILELDRINARLKVIQDRAGQLGLPLPSLSPEEEAALAGTTVDDPSRPDPWRAARTAWDSSLQALAYAASGAVAVVVFLWWAIPPLLFAFWLRRRRTAASTTPAAAPPAA